MNQSYIESPIVLQLRLDLQNIRFYLDHTPPGQHRDQIDAAIKKAFREWDQVHKDSQSKLFQRRASCG